MCLANNYLRVNQGIEKDGLGKTMHNVWHKPKMIQATSYIGTYLEKIEIFEFAEKDWQTGVTNRIAWKLKEDPAKVNVKEVILAHEINKS